MLFNLKCHKYMIHWNTLSGNIEDTKHGHVANNVTTLIIVIDFNKN